MKVITRIDEIARDSRSCLDSDIGIELVEFGFCLGMVDNAEGHPYLAFAASFRRLALKRARTVLAGIPRPGLSISSS